MVRVRTDLVAVPLVVTDARGRRVSGLNAEDFALLDDARPASIDYFASGTDRVALLFAFDASGSAREIVTQQHEAAMALFSRFGRGSRVAVLHFGETVRLAAGFTSDATTIEYSFNIPAQATNGTAIFDAAATAVAGATREASGRMARAHRLARRPTHRRTHGLPSAGRRPAGR